MSLSLGAIVASAFSSIAASIDGAVKNATYVTAGTQTYNPTTGAVSNTGTTYSNIPAVFTQYSRKEKETDFHAQRRQMIEAGDMKCLIPYASLPITVDLADTIIDGNGRSWRIVDYSVDPTGSALHTFQLRQA